MGPQSDFFFTSIQRDAFLVDQTNSLKSTKWNKNNMSLLKFFNLMGHKIGKTDKKLVSYLVNLVILPSVL